MLNELRLAQVSAVDVVDVRHEVLRPGRPRETAIFAGDDAPDTFHMGAFASGGAGGHMGAFASGGAGGHMGAFASGGAGQLVGVVTMLVNASERHPQRFGSWQLRGMAVVAPQRGQGVGAALLDAALEEASARGGTFVWCNARRAAVNLYLRGGFTVVGPEFEIEGIGPHSYMERKLSPAAPVAH